MGTVLVDRREPRGLEGDRGRRYDIEVDGKVLGSIGRREQLRLKLAPGEHLFRARIDWTGSAPLRTQVPETGELRLLVEPRVNVLTAVTAIFSRYRWLNLRIYEDEDAGGSSRPSTRRGLARFLLGLGYLLLAFNLALAAVALLEHSVKRATSSSIIVGVVLGLLMVVAGRRLPRPGSTPTSRSGRYK